MKNPLYTSLLFFAFALQAKVTIETSLDFRPSWIPAGASLHTENEIATKLFFKEDLALSYVQEFAGALSTNSELKNFELRDGAIRLDSRFSSNLRFEPRILIPTSYIDREQGFSGGMRPIFIFEILESVSGGLELSESIIAKLYTISGPIVNLENRMDLTPKLSLFQEKLLVKLPLIWQWKRFTTSELWWNPEAVYQISSSTGVGIAYYTQNLMTTGDETLFTAFKTGVLQVVLQYTL